jgi:hypothetical protein
MKADRTAIFSVLCPKGDKAKSAVEIGRRVLRLLTELPAAWGQGSLGRDVAGDPCNLSSVHLSCTCIAGAALIAGQPSNASYVDGPGLVFLGAVGQVVGGTRSSPSLDAVAFNDAAPDVSKVREAVAKAVVILEKQAAVRQQELPL